MMPQVILHEAGDEKVTVIVVIVASQFQWLAGRLTSSFQSFRLQLLFEKNVCHSLIHQYFRLAGSAAASLYEGAGIMGRPKSLVSTQVG